MGQKQTVALQWASPLYPKLRASGREHVARSIPAHGTIKFKCIECDIIAVRSQKRQIIFRYTGGEFCNSIGGTPMENVDLAEQ
jgi:hypothetical protein